MTNDTRRPARWDDPLRAAWDRALAVLRAPGSAVDPADLRAAAARLEAAGRTLATMDALRTAFPTSSLAALALETVDALSHLTDDGIRQQDAAGLLSWLLSQDAQLRARVDSWGASARPGSAPPSRPAEPGAFCWRRAPC